MNKNKAFSNFNEEKRKYDYKKHHNSGPFMNEFGEDIISEVVQNEIHVKSKNNKLQKDNKTENNSSNN